MKKFLCVCLALGMCSIASACSGLFKDKIEVVSGPTISVGYNSYLGYKIEVRGTARNTMSREFSYVSIEYSVYDAQGNNMGTVLDNMNNLGAGESWSFKAESFGWFSQEVKSYKLAEIIYW